MPEQTNVRETLADEAYSASKKFLSSVLFVDDEIKMGEKTGEGLSATNITDAFAAESIVPSFYSCSHENQYEKILALIRKTDVFVLDWKMPVKRVNAEEDPDADADSDGDRGFFAKKLIEALRKDESLGPRLIFIYTSEFEEVVKYIKNLPGAKRRSGGSVETVALGGDSEAELLKDATDETRPATERNEDLEWVSANGNVRICAYFKESLKDNHGVDQSRVLTEAQLAEFVLKEYARLHEGILPITLLRLLATVRDNTRPLMAKFNAKLDQAFVIDRAMTPKPLDADQMLIELMINAAASLVDNKNLTWKDETSLVRSWLVCKGRGGFLKNELYLTDRGGNEIVLKDDDLCEWQENGYFKFLHESKGVGKGKIDCYDKCRQTNGLLADAQQVFVPAGVHPEEVRKLCRDYAVLSQWKRLSAGQELAPMLTLGTVVAREGDECRAFFLCVQPSCDTYRIKNGGRDFLFLPLSCGTAPFDIILDDAESDICGLHVDSHAYGIQKFFFKMRDVSDGVIKATKKSDGRFVFSAEIEGKVDDFIWIGDLNETHALKIVQDYVANLSRVGISESEWLRRNGSLD